MINLLPPQEKKELWERQSQKIIILLGLLISLFFVSLILGLLAIKFYLSGQNIFQKTVVDLAKKELENQSNQEIKKEVLNLNKDIALISSFYQTNIRLTKLLKKIIESLPPGIQLKSLAYQKDDSSLLLTGFSPTREDLYLLKNNLSKEEEFSEISFPSSNWVKAKEIDFFISLRLSPKK